MTQAAAPRTRSSPIDTTVDHPDNKLIGWPIADRIPRSARKYARSKPIRQRCTSPPSPSPLRFPLSPLRGSHTIPKFSSCRDFTGPPVASPCHPSLVDPHGCLGPGRNTSLGQDMGQFNNSSGLLEVLARGPGRVQGGGVRRCPGGEFAVMKCSAMGLAASPTLQFPTLQFPTGLCDEQVLSRPFPLDEALCSGCSQFESHSRSFLDSCTPSLQESISGGPLP